MASGSFLSSDMAFRIYLGSSSSWLSSTRRVGPRGTDANTRPSKPL